MVTVSLYHCHPVNAKQLPLLMCFSNLFQPLLIRFNFHRSFMLQLFVTQIVFNLGGDVTRSPKKNPSKIVQPLNHQGLQVEEDVDESRGKAEPLRPKWFQQKKRIFTGRLLETEAFFPQFFFLKIFESTQPINQHDKDFVLQIFSQSIATALARRRSFTSQSLVTWLCIKRHLEGAEVGSMGDGENWKSCFKLDNDINW